MPRPYILPFRIKPLLSAPAIWMFSAFISMATMLIWTEVRTFPARSPCIYAVRSDPTDGGYVYNTGDISKKSLRNTEITTQGTGNSDSSITMPGLSYPPTFNRITVTELHPTFGAEISGVDFSRPVEDDVFQEIQAAISKVGTSREDKAEFR